MVLKVRLGEVLSPAIMAAHDDHIRDFLAQEGIEPDPDDLSATEMSERQIKELMAELADDLEG